MFSPEPGLTAQNCGCEGSRTPVGSSQEQRQHPARHPLRARPGEMVLTRVHRTHINSLKTPFPLSLNLVFDLALNFEDKKST